MQLNDFKQLLESALNVTANKLAEFPKYGVYLHAMEQLSLIQTIIANGKVPMQEEKDRINLGLMAVRELETSDPDYCELLCEVDYRFKKL